MKEAVEASGMSEGRALLTEREREALVGDESDSYRYKTRSYLRNRLGKLERDAELLAKHEPELYDRLQSVVCDGATAGRESGRETASEPPEENGSQHTDTHPPRRESATAPSENDELRDRVRDDLMGSDELLEARVDGVLKMYDYLREHGEATKSELLNVVDIDAVDYADAGSVWSNMVKGKDTLRALPGVEKPPTGRSKWRYTGGDR